MKKRLFFIMFVLMAIATGAWADAYGVYICGVMVTDDNINSLSSIDGVKGGTITFDGTTLTLTDVTIDASNKQSYGMSHVRNDLTIHLEGTNRIFSDLAAVCLRGNTTITGPGKLEATGKEQGIMLEYRGNSVRLTTQDEAHIVAKGDKYGIYGKTSSSESVLIDRSTKEVEAWGGDGSFCNTSGIIIRNPLKVMKPIGAKVSATGSDIVDADGNVVKGEWVKIAEPVRIAINETNFPDEIFRHYVKRCFDIDGDDILTDAEIQEATAIYVNYEFIADFKGIEFFTELKELYCCHNKFTSIDLSKNTELKILNVSENSLSSIDLSKNTALTYLNCDNCEPLGSIDVSKNTELKTLFCCYCNLSAIDVSKNTKLEIFSVHGNNLTSLNVSNNKQLKELSCSQNKINATEMGKLVNSMPVVTGEKGKFYPFRTYLDDHNVITTAQVAEAKSKNWRVLDYDTNMDDVDYEGVELTGIAINATNFPDENFRAYVKAACQSDGDDILTDEEIAAVTEIYLNSSSIADLKGIEFFTVLKQLSCINCSLPSLDLSNNTALDYLDCTHNSLTSLDLSNNTALKTLNCSINQLTKLDVSNNTALTTLWCADNYLTSLDLSKNTALKALVCYSNELTSLDLSNNTALESLDCSLNQLSSLDLSNNTALVYVNCSYTFLTSLVVSKDASSLNQIACFYNQIKGAAMDKLVESLPDNDKDKYLLVYIMDDEYEGNEMTVRQVAAAKKKKWYAGCSDSNIIDWYYYDGIDAVDTPTAIPTVTLEASSDSPFYSLDGQRIVGKPTKKGVYVRNGRKVVVK